jgi:osmoprotectant transport system permease protein
LLALVQVGVTRRSTVRTLLGTIGLAALTLVALIPSIAKSPAEYSIGSKTFTEQYILAALIEQRLEAAGLTAERRPGLGSNVLFDSLASSEVDVAVDYSGTLWANRMQRKDVPQRDQMLRELSEWLSSAHGIQMVGPLGFENAYALAMERRKSESMNIHSITDLAARASQLSIAGDYEIFARPEWAALRTVYGLNFRAQRQMQPEFMYQAAADGEVDVIAAYTSDGQIATYGLAVLADVKHAIPSYDAILLISPKRAGDTRLMSALKPLIGSIDVATMRAANARASKGDQTPDTVAGWLTSEIAKKRN